MKFRRSWDSNVLGVGGLVDGFEGFFWGGGV